MHTRPSNIAALLWGVLALYICALPCSAGPGSLRVLQEEAAADATWGSIFSASAAAADASDLDAGYSYLLTQTQRARGLTYMGSAERLRLALNRAVLRKRLTVAVLGASISAGAGAYDDLRDAWVDRLEAWLMRGYGKQGVNVTVNNGAVPGTTSSYMCACFRRHVPADADIIFVEYAVNDDHRKEPLMHNSARRPFERLLRKLLQMPSRPAVVLLNAYAWFNTEPFEGIYWSSAEREFQEFAWYYSLPTVSIKAATYHDMVAGRQGFSVESVRERDSAGLRHKVFYYDWVHPDGNTGHRVMAELAMHLISEASKNLRASPVTDADTRHAEAPLPRPMIRDNHASLHDTCFVGPLFKDACVKEHDGWEWVNESKGPRPKWGYVAKEPGKVLHLHLNTSVSVTTKDKPVLVQLAYLRSYKHMGWAEVTCLSGCECPPTRFNGHMGDRKSLLTLHKLFVTQHDACVLAVEVLADTDSGEHKVKLAGAIVSDQAGEQQGLDNAGAVEHVHDISFRHGGFGANTVFDVRNHV